MLTVLTVFPTTLTFHAQIFIINIQLAICQQWLFPVAFDSLKPFKDMEWAKMIQRVLMLSVSTVLPV